MDVSCPAYLDEKYIIDQTERMKQYTSLSKLESLDELNALKNQTEETYGNVPKELLNLYKIALLKNLLVKLGAKRLLLNAQKTQIYLYRREDIVSKQCALVLSDNKDKMVLKFEDVPIIEINLGNKSIEEKLDFLINFAIDATKQ